MTHEYEIDRDAVREVYRLQNLDALNAAVARGEWTRAEADQAHRAFMASALLQQLIDRDIEYLTAHMRGQVH